MHSVGNRFPGQLLQDSGSKRTSFSIIIYEMVSVLDALCIGGFCEFWSGESSSKTSCSLCTCDVYVPRLNQPQIFNPQLIEKRRDKSLRGL